ncbi:type IV pili methyl-accepting chemotaxis transducer N-terminal domain-containing protein [Fulvivirgaceae bacterium PWU5]|uniref:histidine kinase n=1 Tax=Dawidia cretensis TaxID=2782350 RepID=A0AAP2DZ22_9BACT|nr:ATP-binding protein [Dawidia cretensis]MBT1708858.1 type IV pili methyl-accepting chemotaxis transducer N-terminal domain-containing protein [Dawidia cretensis]
MLPQPDPSATIQRSRFSRLGTLYVLALSVIATVAITGQALIQSHLQAQRSDSRVVNVAGKQRMLSQKITKTLLYLEPAQSAADRQTIVADLDAAYHLWHTSQRGLQYGNDSLHLPGRNSAAITQLFQEAAVPYSSMDEHTSHILTQLKQDPRVSYDSLRASILVVRHAEGAFLQGMERIVAQYEVEANDKIESLSRIEYIILAIVIGTILLEFVFIFRPTTVYVSNTLHQLMTSEKNARKLSKEIGELYASLEKSYEQLSIVNQPPESPRLLARADRGGNVLFLADAFVGQVLVGASQPEGDLRLSDLFDGIGDPGDWMDVVIDTVSEGTSWQGELALARPSGTMAWMDVTITPVYEQQGQVSELLVFVSDITLRKEAEHGMKQKNKAEIERKINQQKFRSVLILEGQEEERKRLAMDIHDGIGQMLTSLNFQISAIDLVDTAKAEKKIAEIDHLVKDVIKEVRRVTFNLKPTVLGDYGLQAALNVFIHEIAKLTAMSLTYTSEGTIERLPENVENNIFRITQEAINNAIKYSASPQVDVTLSQTDSDLLVSVRDTGKGFDARALKDRNIDISSGRGLFNMYERTEYIHGRLEIRSELGAGTTVLLTVPLRAKTLS